MGFLLDLQSQQAKQHNKAKKACFSRIIYADCPSLAQGDPH